LPGACPSGRGSGTGSCTSGADGALSGILGKGRDEETPAETAVGEIGFIKCLGTAVGTRGGTAAMAAAANRCCCARAIALSSVLSAAAAATALGREGAIEGYPATGPAVAEVETTGVGGIATGGPPADAPDTAIP
jgi:hypothetical protein